MTENTAYLLVSHGSRHSSSQIAEAQLAELVRQQLQERRSRYREAFSQTTAVMPKIELPLVSTAALELAPLPLHEQIIQFARNAQENGSNCLKIFPLFLLPGVHVKEDIPNEVFLAQQVLADQIEIELQPYLGKNPGLVNLLAQHFFHLSGDARILLSHGSRREGANELIEAIASQVNAVAAYWFVSPSLREQVTALINVGKKRIAIVPYFLFSGGTTEAIAMEIEALQSEFSTVELQLGNPLDASSEQLAELIVDSIKP